MMATYEIIDSDSGEVREETTESWTAAVRLSDHWMTKTRRTHNVRPKTDTDPRDAEAVAAQPRRRLFAR